MAGREVLGGGPDRDGARPPGGEQARRRVDTARRHRRARTVGTVLVVAAAAVLAGRSLPEPRTEPPVPRPAPVARVPDRYVADVGVGTRWAFALVASCVGPDTRWLCTYRLLRRSLGGGGWDPTAVRTGLVAADSPARLYVTGDDAAIVDQPDIGTVYTSSGGGRLSRRALRPGPPIAAVPPGAVVDLGMCGPCRQRLTVLEPASGLLRPLATQPPPTTRPPLAPVRVTRAVVQSGGTLWVLGDGGSRLVSAVSVDRGRTWRELPMAARAPAEVVRLAADGGRGAYLLIDRYTRSDALAEFSELWHAGDPTRPGAAWRQVTPAIRPHSVAGLVAGHRGLIVRDDAGDLWRLVAGGTMRRLPRVTAGGMPVRPSELVTGPGRVLLGVADNQSDLGGPTVLISYDEGDSWRVEPVPG